VIRLAMSGSALTLTPSTYIGALLMALAMATVLWSAGLFRRRLHALIGEAVGG